MSPTIQVSGGPAFSPEIAEAIRTSRPDIVRIICEDLERDPDGGEVSVEEIDSFLRDLSNKILDAVLSQLSLSNRLAETMEVRHQGEDVKSLQGVVEATARYEILKQLKWQLSNDPFK